MTELKLPSLGEGIEKGTIISIAVKAGDTIEAEQTLMEVETDKVVVEVPADTAGTIEKLLVNVGDEIGEGTPIIQLIGGDVTATAESVALTAAQEEAVRTLVKEPEVVPKKERKTEKLVKASIELKLPSLGEGIEKGTVIAIHIKQGDTITLEQTLMEVETDKVVVEVPADAAGTIEKLLVKIGDEIGEGTPIIFLQIEQDELAEMSTELTVEKETYSEVEVETTQSYNSTPSKVLKPEKKGKFRASPLARKMAREIGIDITTMTLAEGSQRISVQDVKEYSKLLHQNRGEVGPSIAKVELPDFSKWGSVKRVAMAGITQATSKNMTTTWSQIPHAWLQEKVDITDLEAKRQIHKYQVKQKGGALTITSILVKVISKALEEFPIFNTSLDANTNEIIYKDYINVGVAVDSNRGLMVPVLRDSNTKGIVEISQDLVQLSEKVKSKKISPDELQGGTFTISNLGGIGTSAIFPLVNHPQAAILGVAASTKEAVWINNAFEPRLLMPLTIGFDHRIINGADAARFLKYVKELLEDWFLWNM